MTVFTAGTAGAALLTMAVKTADGETARVSSWLLAVLYGVCVSTPAVLLVRKANLSTSNLMVNALFCAMPHSHPGVSVSAKGRFDSSRGRIDCVPFAVQVDKHCPGWGLPVPGGVFLLCFCSGFDAQEADGGTR